MAFSTILRQGCSQVVNDPSWGRHALDTDHVNYWSDLSRINNLLVIMNIGMFFLTGSVAKGHFYTCYSLGCLGGVGVLVPTMWIHRLGYYWTFLVVEPTGRYFLVASVIYRVKNSSG